MCTDRRRDCCVLYLLHTQEKSNAEIFFYDLKTDLRAFIPKSNTTVKTVSVSPYVKDSVIICVVYTGGPLATVATTLSTTTVSESTSQFPRSPDDTSSTITGRLSSNSKIQVVVVVIA